MLCRGTLFDRDFGANGSFASKAADFALLVGDDAVAVSVDGVVAAELGANASALGKTNLANNYLAGGNFFATKELNTKALPGTVMIIFT